MKVIGTFGVACAALFVASLAQAGVVELTKGEQSVKATIDGEVFTVLHTSPDRRKPFFLPVIGPDSTKALERTPPSDEPGAPGRNVMVASESAALHITGGSKEAVKLGDILPIEEIQGDKFWVTGRNGWIAKGDVAPLAANVTRLINDKPEPVKDRLSPMYYDHPHHKGIWMSVDEVNDVKFWNEDGLIRNQSVEIVEAKGNPAVIKMVNHWIGPEGKPLLIETTTASIFANRLLTYDVTFTAAVEQVTFGDTKEGMFAIRLPNSMREFAGGGPVTNSDGAAGTKDAWGRTANWVNYDGPVAGNIFGVTIMDHPDNPRKSRYHVRDYGLFSINPFGPESYSKGRDDAEPASPLVLKQGESVRFRYGLWVHGPETDKSSIDKAYTQFVEYERAE